MTKKTIKSSWQEIPQVGPATEQSLLSLGYQQLEDLRGADPNEMYKRECKIKGGKNDRCQLYMFKMLVYRANTAHPQKEKLNWAYWKDKKDKEKK